MAKCIAPQTLPIVTGTFYPPPYDQPCRARQRRNLDDAAGLTQFGVNLLRPPPDIWSSPHHWHTGQDECVYVPHGEIVHVTDAGDEILKPGDCAGIKAGDKDGHHLQSRGSAEALLLEIVTLVARMAGSIPTSTWHSRSGHPPCILAKTACPMLTSGGAPPKRKIDMKNFFSVPRCCWPPRLPLPPSRSGTRRRISRPPPAWAAKSSPSISPTR